MIDKRGVIVTCFLLAPLVSCHMQGEQVRFRQILQDQIVRYPLMELQDLYKLVHQAALGSEHAVEDVAGARRWMATEIATLTSGPEDPMIDFLRPDGQLVRVHLRPYLAAGGDSEDLLGAFVKTANTYDGSVDVLQRYWRYAELSASEGELPFTREDMKTFFARQADKNHPAVHHSVRYEAAYAPAYRVTDRTYLVLPE